ncbi:hypothetical protein DPMN_181921 [Dreissena polymorpha]|uniref:Uncharacterized protein n=1 Tax=Dreissena polymorpha TaxID=45954 RepID=A0A9D4DDR8_DREPO|nr:hypothetical protein DPMN_181921 [Dreissena polymorpha]
MPANMVCMERVGFSVPKRSLQDYPLQMKNSRNKTKLEMARQRLTRIPTPYV